MSPYASAEARPSGAPLQEGEFAFTSRDFETIAQILYSESGIYLKPTKSTLVYGRLAKRLRALGMKDFREYCNFILRPEGEAERREMRAALTTNVTRFFRENHHFEHMKAHVLPRLSEPAKRGHSIRIWSAACSTGQEPYSLALTVLSSIPGAASLDIKILATDIDPHCLATARQGRYGEDIVADVPADLRHRYFKRLSGADRETWEAGEELKALVSFRELNLVGNWPMKKSFHIVMCRNVVIYFDEPTQQAIWRKLPGLMTRGGTLYVGHSERVTGDVANAFKLVGNSTYQFDGEGR